MGTTARPDVGPRELELVTQVLRSDVLAMGPFTQRFEEGIASVAGRREGVACSSGTAGLHLSVRALEIGEGDEVITTPFSFVTSANCLLGFRPGDFPVTERVAASTLALPFSSRLAVEEVQYVADALVAAVG